MKLNQEQKDDYFEEVTTFLERIKSTIINISFDPKNREELNQCIDEMEIAIDKKMQGLTHNHTVKEKAEEIKAYFKQQILAQAQQ